MLALAVFFAGWALALLANSYRGWVNDETRYRLFALRDRIRRIPADGREFPPEKWELFHTFDGSLSRVIERIDSITLPFGLLALERIEKAEKERLLWFLKAITEDEDFSAPFWSYWSVTVKDLTNSAVLPDREEERWEDIARMWFRWIRKKGNVWNRWSGRGGNRRG
jgi:hypothetical protein